MYYWLSLSTWDERKLPNFWIYEWRIHGSAAQEFIDPSDYFRRAVELTRYTDLLNTLGRAGIVANGSSYDKNDYKRAIKAKTGYDPVLSCVFNNSHYHLKEVTICVNAEATNFIPCTPRPGSCRLQSIKFPRPVIKK